MDKIDYYFIGIGGISMSALASLLHNEGKIVAGSDAVKSAITEGLNSLGIEVNYTPNLQAVAKTETIVISSAIANDNSELVYARMLGKIVLGRGELLGRLASRYKNVIAVSGAHGKTTTTALLASIFECAGAKPTVHIGGLLCGSDSNLIIGDRDYFITEACEYKDNFLYLKPTFGIVLNVEAEHLDYFKSFEGVKRSFRRFISQCEYSLVPHGFGGNMRKFGVKMATEDEKGVHLKLCRLGQYYVEMDCPLYGEHNIQNILVAVETAEHFGLAKEAIVAGLAKYKGVKRRYEKHNLGKGQVIFDYAHHPTEIEKVIATARKYCKGRLIVLFQPHTYSRTRLLFSDFVNCLQKADELIVFKTYSAREEYEYAGDAVRLYEKLKDGGNCKYSEDYHILEKMKDNLDFNDTVLVLGAGDFYDKVDFDIFN